MHAISMCSAECIFDDKERHYYVRFFRSINQVYHG